jgi:hypothetical protein
MKRDLLSLSFHHRTPHKGAGEMHAEDGAENCGSEKEQQPARPAPGLILREEKVHESQAPVYLRIR